MASLLSQSNIDWLTTTSFHYAATANRPWNMAAVIPDNYIPVTEEDWGSKPVTGNQKSSN